MRSLVLLLCITFCFDCLAQQPSLEWAKAMGTTGSGLDVTVDNHGNVYTVGGFLQTVDFDYGVGVYELTSNGGFDVYIQKLDSNGNFIWARQIGGEGNEALYFDGPPFNGIPNSMGLSVNLDNNGNIYITGTFLSDSVDCDPGLDSVYLEGNGVMLIKLDSNGNFIWAKRAVSDGILGECRLDSNNNIFITGYFNFVSDFDPSLSDTFELTANFRDIFIQKLDADGNLIWVKQIGSSGYDEAFSIELDNEMNVLISGSFEDTVDFDPGVGTYFLIDSLGLSSINFLFVLKLDSDGNFLWAKSLKGVIGVFYPLTVDADNNVYLTNRYKQTIDIDPGPDTVWISPENFYGMFILSLDGSGDFRWGKSISSAYTLSDIAPLSIAVEGDQLLIGGSYSGLIDFDPDTGIAQMQSANYSESFLLKMDLNASYQWSRSLPYVYTQGSEVSEVRSLWLRDNYIYATGFSTGSIADYDPSEDTLSVEGDIFVFKWKDDSLFVSDNVEKIIPFEGKVYPNPTSGQISIELSESRSNVEITVASIEGRVLEKRSYADTQKINMLIEQGKGIYLLSVFDGEKEYFFKLIKN